MLQIAHIANSPTFQIRPHYKSSPLQICPHSKFAMLQIAHVFNCPYFQFPHVEGLIAISPYTGVIRTFASIRVNTQKRRHGLGMRAFACVVGANWNSPTFQIRHVTIRPYCNSPYAVACVFSLNSPILQIAPIPNSPMFSIALIPNRPWDKKLEKSFLL